MASKTFNVGIIGYGTSAKVFHVPFIATTPQLRLHSVVQRSPRAGSSAREDHPEAQQHTDAAQLLADPDVDVVVVTTPPDSHFALTKAALEAGKHVLTEKPFVPTAAEADEPMALAARHRRLLCVYQNRRWDTDFLLVRHLVASGALGRVVELDSHFDRYRAAPPAPASWKAGLGIPSGGSALFDLGTHLVDQAYVLFGMPSAVHGRLLSQRAARPDLFNPDAVAAELAYPDGKLVRVRISALSAETTQPRFWLRATGGSFRKRGLDPQEDQLKAGMDPASAALGREDPGNMRLVLARPDGTLAEEKVPELEPETYRAFYAAFARALEAGDDALVPVKASEARDVLRILEAVVESARTGRDVVFS
ncbi:NAD(P)-binding domain protein [Metarhizium album ARSEF 1941]|uniref:NAD(P)-binding domain protein n=1 Tax=Metarhizium album (strain ARSEF 1941) TaxID=1081103 RepID=A0A0B2WUJ8_METAS|nr:NAD(P)-binding domain protein [Metarhizium album ARSEF 1941]KHN97269.1 NAD(P)-binding domain protein [Metarhizium album ARSEF 1941]